MDGKNYGLTGFPENNRGKEAAGEGEKAAPVHVVHLLVGFTVGGAETLVLDLAKGTDPAVYAVTVVSLKGAGPFQARFEKAGIRTAVLPCLRF